MPGRLVVVQRQVLSLVVVRRQHREVVMLVPLTVMIFFRVEVLEMANGPTRWFVGELLVRTRGPVRDSEIDLVQQNDDDDVRVEVDLKAERVVVFQVFVELLFVRDVVIVWNVFDELSGFQTTVSAKTSHVANNRVPTADVFVWTVDVSDERSGGVEVQTLRGHESTRGNVPIVRERLVEVVAVNVHLRKRHLSRCDAEAAYVDLLHGAFEDRFE